MQKIKYPDGRADNTFSKQAHLDSSNIGLDFEEEVIQSCNYYKEIDKALIYKRPTPTKIIKKVNEKHFVGSFVEKSTTDFVGVYKGKYIDFECKRTLNEYFLVNQIKEHQINHLLKVAELGGLSFILLEMSYQEKIYLIPSDVLKIAVEEKTTRFTIEFLDRYAVEVKQKINPRVDFLSAVDSAFNVWFLRGW